LGEKFVSCATRVMSEEDAHEALRRVRALERAAGVTDVMPFLERGRVSRS